MARWFRGVSPSVTRHLIALFQTFDFSSVSRYTRLTLPRVRTPPLVFLDESIELPEVPIGVSLRLSSGDPTVLVHYLYSRRGFTHFSTASRHAFHLFLAVLVRYRPVGYLDLPRRARHIGAGLPSHVTLSATSPSGFRLRDSHPLRCVSPDNFVSPLFDMSQSTRPFRDSDRSVPFSFATTEGITIVFFSCPYYNALVGGVPPPG